MFLNPTRRGEVLMKANFGNAICPRMTTKTNTHQDFSSRVLGVTVLGPRRLGAEYVGVNV
jgi:hypothetical protein